MCPTDADMLSGGRPHGPSYSAQMVDHSATSAASVHRLGRDGPWVLALYDSALELVESVPLAWDGTGDFHADALNFVGPELNARGLSYRGGWSASEGRWEAVIHRLEWPPRRKGR